MSSFLFDTCLFIDYWNGDSAAQSLVNDVMTGKVSASFSTITATELWQYSSLSRKEEIQYLALTKFFLIEAPLTNTAAIQAGQWLRSLSRSTRRRVSADALIAATAKERGEVIRTRNVREIKRFYPMYLIY